MFKTETAYWKQQNVTMENENQNERVYNEKGCEWATEIDTADKKLTQISVF